MLSNCGSGEDSWEFPGLQGDQISQSWRKSTLNIHWKDWWWSWNSYTLATWCKELTHLKRPWYWERLKVGGEGDNRGWDGWMASQTRWTWVWVSSGSWWWTGKPGCNPWGYRVRHDWATELNWANSQRSEKIIHLLIRKGYYLTIEIWENSNWKIWSSEWKIQWKTWKIKMSYSP